MNKKILIISGGISKERTISLDTGKQVAKELIKNNKFMRSNNEEITIYKSVGDALSDLAAARLAYRYFAHTI